MKDSPLPKDKRMRPWHWIRKYKIKAQTWADYFAYYVMAAKKRLEKDAAMAFGHGLASPIKAVYKKKVKPKGR